MKRLAIVAAALLLANIVEVEIVAGWRPLLAAPDRVAEVVAQVRKALGGDRLAAVKALTAEGPFRRSMGQRDMEGTIALTLVRPDKFRRTEEIGMGGMVGGPLVERVTTFNGVEAWDDVQNRGGMGGGMRMVFRGPDGPGGPGAGGPGGLTPEQMQQQRARQARTELLRWMVAFFAESTEPFTDAGVAESPDGKADVLETRDEAGRPVRLFVDQSTHLPLMVQYQQIRPRMVMAGGPGGGRPANEEELRQRVEEMRRQGLPPPSTFSMHLADYKRVDGVMLPHRVSISIEGEPNEEWTIEKFKVNPSIKADDFVKPKA